jgi:hypothetical protein
MLVRPYQENHLRSLISAAVSLAASLPPRAGGAEEMKDSMAEGPMSAGEWWVMVNRYWLKTRRRGVHEQGP